MSVEICKQSEIVKNINHIEKELKNSSEYRDLATCSEEIEKFQLLEKCLSNKGYKVKLEEYDNCDYNYSYKVVVLKVSK